MIALTDKYQPATLDAFAGLTVAKKLLASLIAEPYESAWLFTGDSGTGKTSMGLALAVAMKAELHHIASRQCDLEGVERTCHACWYTPMNGGWHIVLVDEADRMTQPAQLAFLSKLDGTTRPPNTIFIFTANETKLLEKRFISRCRVVPFDGRREIEASRDFLARVWALESTAPAPDFAALLDQHEGNIRAVLNALEMELIAPGSTVIEPSSPIAHTRPVSAPATVPQSSDDSPTIDAQELAHALRINSSTVYTWVKRGKIPQPIRKAPWTWNRSQISHLVAA
jgi:replication-associated recombination protein RarA/predicted DNA-binding transcriptional regulator AlpA